MPLLVESNNLLLHCHCSCNKPQFIISIDNSVSYSVLGHQSSQWHLLHSVVLNRWSWEWPHLTTTGSPHGVWTKLHISHNHSTRLRWLMQALLCVDSWHHSKWTAKSLQQEMESGGVQSKWRWEQEMYVHNISESIFQHLQECTLYILIMNMIRVQECAQPLSHII